MDKINKSLTKTGENGNKILGVFYKKPDGTQVAMDYALIIKNLQNVEMLPFYFDPVSEQVLNLSNFTFSKLVKDKPKDGDTGNFITNIMKITDKLDETKLRIELNNFIEKLKNNPSKYQNKYKKLLDTCSEIENISPYIYTQPTNFEFPRSLLNTIKAMVLSEYEACGAISVSKFSREATAKVKTTTPQEELFTKGEPQYNYDVIFHTDQPEACNVEQFAYFREITFHTHPFNFDTNKEGIHALYDLILFNIDFPSSIDVQNITRNLLDYSYDYHIIFVNSGLYVFRKQELGKLDHSLLLGTNTEKLEKNRQRHYKLKEDFNDEKALQMNKELVWLLLFKLADMDGNEYIKALQNVESAEEALKANPMKLDLITKQKEAQDKQYTYINQAMEKLKEIKINFIDILQNQELVYKNMKKLGEIINQTIKNNILPLINSGGNYSADEKIEITFIPVEFVDFNIYGKRKSGWYYPNFYVKVNPRLAGFRGAMATRRLSMRK